ncbi:hypothetical protein [Vogesella sp. XCS3]|uniref:hypothetical protein n=1 Tax=Vogesella sp. XCS3 TaxID=2877939 RepID=UPI001D0A14EB|nr:hypothetical protein [Vogesella sp. XCS3]UDM18824.1 hypothetical protein LCH97_18295 [Vogesella sp. XCS3]
MRKKQAGEILIGLVIATVAIGMVLAYFGLKQINDWRVTRGQIVGGALAELGKGVNSFVTQYHPQIVAAMFGGATQVTDSGGTVIVNNALQPTAAEIIKIAGMSGLGATPSIPGASYKIVLSPGSSCAIQATCNVNSLTYIDKPLVMPYPGAADNIDYMAAAAAVQTIGINGGASFSPNNANLTFQSPAGAPQTIPNPVAGTPGGIVAVRGGYIRADFDEFLRRDGTKSMTGNLDMGANSINNAKDFNGTGTVTAGGNVAAGVDVTAARHVTAGQNVTAGGVVSGDVLTPNKEVVEGTSCAGYASGAIAKDAAGLTLSCQSGSWEQATAACTLH